MYVLDSIVKNVGTPYTLFLGRNLYHTFMNAYTLVNNQIRRKLDEMLRTWKEPVPGSLDTKPVFPPDITRPIENALIKARTAAVQQQQQQQFRSQQEMMAQMRQVPQPNGAWRNTPTPPQANGQFRPPGQAFPPSNLHTQAYPPPNLPNGHPQVCSIQHNLDISNFDKLQNPFSHQQYPQNLPPRPVPSPYQQPYGQALPQPLPQTAQYPQFSNQNQDLQILHSDIDNLIRKARDEFAANIHDTSIQTRLKALLDLQGLMQQQQLPPHEIQMIRDQVNALSRPVFNASTPAPPVYSPPLPAPPIQSPFPQVRRPAPAPQPIPQTTDLQALLSSNNLADIIAKAQRATPTPPLATASLATAQPVTPINAQPPAAAAPAAGSDLMASLRAAGLLPADAVTPANGVLPFTLPPSTTLPPSQIGPVNDVQLTPMSLKM